MGVDLEDFLIIQKYLGKLQEERLLYQKNFEKYLVENKTHIENSLIKKFVEIEERYLIACHQIEKTDFEFLESYSKQLMNLQKKIANLGKQKALENLRIARVELYKKHTGHELEYLKHLKVFQSKVLQYENSIELPPPQTNGRIKVFLDKFKTELQEKELYTRALQLLKDKLKTFKPLKKEVKIEIDTLLSDEQISLITNDPICPESIETLKYISYKISLWGIPEFESILEKVDFSDPDTILMKVLICLEEGLDELSVQFQKFQLSLIDEKTIVSWENEIFERSYNSFFSRYVNS